MIALLLAQFLVHQYAAKPAVLRGCAECAGEPDDRCDVPAGAQVRKLEEYSKLRWAAAGRLKLLRSSADTGCAVQAKQLFSRGPVQLAAVRMMRAAPSQALLEHEGVGPASQGWPIAPQQRHAEKTSAARPQRTALRAALVCWPSDAGWPAREQLEAANFCEWWLLPVRGDDNAPDLTAQSFPLGGAGKFAWGDSRWPKAFTSDATFDESLFLPLPVSPSIPVAAAKEKLVCGDSARGRSALLDRFDQWEARVRGARSSIDRASLTLDAAAWSGHCQELDVLRGALEEQLGCVLQEQGKCLAMRSP